MYIKFCRSLFVDKTDEDNGNLSKLSVELEEDRGKQSGGNPHLYRTACVFLGLICLILLLVVIVLGVKLQSGSTSCPAGEGRSSVAPTCDFARCQADYNTLQAQQCQCHQCAPDWKAFGQSCFYFSTTRLSWGESLQNCTSRGGSLAIISSKALQAFLTNEGNKGMAYWIGLRRNGTTWTWVNKNVLQASYWAEDPKSGDCAFLHREKVPAEKNWVEASCRSSSYFICQLDF